MSLPEPLIQTGHLFSQHSLNTFARCPRRFLLKYVDRQPWPVPENDDPTVYEEHLSRGRVFHQWVARKMLGIPIEPLVTASEDPELIAWWTAFAEFDLSQFPTYLRAVEMPLVVPLDRYRLYARYDLLAINPQGAWLVVDWKTLQARPSPRVLATRMQTRAYLYALAAAGHVLTGGPPPKPEQLQMFYWFTNYPDEPAVIPYSAEKMSHDVHELTELVRTIAETPREGFVRTQDQRQCRHCNYRTLCDRTEDTGSTTASDAGWLDEDLDASLELDQLQELEY